MGYDLYSKMVLGYKVPKRAQTKLVSRRSCKHALTDENARFCSTCGKPAYVEKSEQVLSDGSTLTGALGKYAVSFGNDEEDCYFVGMEREKLFSFEDLESADLAAMRKDIAMCFKMDGISYLDCTFGMHLVLTHSV